MGNVDICDEFKFLKFEEFIECESKYLNYTSHIFFYAVIAFSIPFFLKHSQLVVGSVVNTLLFLSAKNLKNYDSFPIIFLPSIGAFLGGYLFGSLTSFLIFLVPGIWLGNLVLVFGYKKFRMNGFNKFISSLSVVFLKAVVIGLFALILFINGLIPLSLLLPMSLLQIVTAVVGAINSEVLNKVFVKFC